MYGHVPLRKLNAYDYVLFLQTTSQWEYRWLSWNLTSFQLTLHSLTVRFTPGNCLLLPRSDICVLFEGWLETEYWGNERMRSTKWRYYWLNIFCCYFFLNLWNMIKYKVLINNYQKRLIFIRNYLLPINIKYMFWNSDIYNSFRKKYN